MGTTFLVYQSVVGKKGEGSYIEGAPFGSVIGKAGYPCEPGLRLTRGERI
jgi:hypothetical protein